MSSHSFVGLGRRILIGLCVVTGLAVAGFGALLVYGAVQLGKIPRVACVACEEPPGDGPVNVLVVGSDSRVSVSDDAEAFGTPDMVGGQRSDTIIVLRVDPGGDTAAMLSIPRDLWVPLASGGVNRINAAFEGGPDNLVRTVNGALEIPIHHYVEVEFAGFRDIVRAVGDVTVFFDAPARDAVTGLQVEQAGCVALDGDDALAYVRSRNYETLVDGRWRGGGAGDLDRISRQQDFMRRVLAKLRSVRNPATIHRVVTTGTENLTLDERLSVADIEQLALRFRRLDPFGVEMYTVPTVFDHVVIGRRRASVLRLQQPQAAEAIARFLGRAPVDPPAAPAGRPAPGLVTTTTLPPRPC